MTIYNIHHTQKSKPTINVDETNVDTTATDLKFFGRRRLQYGEDMNQNILFLLEHFACPEDGSHPGNPDLSLASNPSNPTTTAIDFTPLVNPTDGQLWYNSTQQRLFSWDAAGSKWIPMGMQDDIAANWGIIYHGQQLPRPISQKTGYVFQYSECSWIISPYQFPQQIDYMLCETDGGATVSSLYTVPGDPTLRNGFATYLIVGIKDNINLGSLSPIPSNTPTPVISPTPTPTNIAPSGTPPAPTPTPSPMYTGPLTAYFQARFPQDSIFFAGPGTAQPYYFGDNHRIPYPAITDTKYKILYSSLAPPELQTSPLAPHNPWDSVAGNHYIYIKDTPTAGTKGGFRALASFYHKVIFCSGKSTEAGTAMVEGIDGFFYHINGVTDLGGGITQLTLNVEPLATPIDVWLTNHPPLQTSVIDMLKFNYDYVYAMAAYLHNSSDPITGQIAEASCSGVSSTDPDAAFYLCPPTRLEGTFDLYIQGGAPPYTITDIRYYGPQGTGLQVTGSNKTLAVTKTGFVNSGSVSLPAPVSFVDLNTASATKPLFVGPVVFPNANTNIEQIHNGYAVRSYVSADINYGTDYAAKYGAVQCHPEFHWHTDYTSTSSCLNETASCTLLNATCGPTTGKTTSLLADSFCVFIQDSLGTTIVAPVGHGCSFQVIDRDFISQTYNFNVSTVSGPVSGSVLAAGTYSYGLDVSLGLSPQSIRPLSSPAKLQYVFSLLDSPQGNVDPTRAGQFRYNAVTGTTTTSLLPRPTTLNCPVTTITNSNALVHIGCDISNVNPDLQCPSSSSYMTSYSLGPLSPGAYQQITITKVWKNNGTPGVVDISGNPILVKLIVLSDTNTYNWNNLLPDRTGPHTGSFTSPRVPYKMRLDVTIPAGLAFSGTLIIPYAFFAYDNPGGGCAFGTSGGPVGSQTINFANT